MADPITEQPAHASDGPTGDCPCGTIPDAPSGWCGLRHHGLGCQYTNTTLLSVPHRRGATRTVSVCTRCAARALWWLTDPRQRPATHPGGHLGRVLHMGDGTRIPIGRKPPHVPL